MKECYGEISKLQPYLRKILGEHGIRSLEELVDAYPNRLMSFYRFGFTSLRRVEAILPGTPRLERISYSWSEGCRCDFCVRRATEFQMKLQSTLPLQSISPLRTNYRKGIKVFRDNARLSSVCRSERYQYNLVLQLAKFIVEKQVYLSDQDILLLTKVGGRLYKAEMREK